MYVECGGFKSDLFLATSGVPQGSILGPLLFVIYINDIVRDLDCRYLLYADDVNIFCEVHTIDDCLKLQRCLEHINDWCSINQLHLNADKCLVMTFSKKNMPLQFAYHLNNVNLNRPDTVKDLGVYFDPKLSFKPHIEKTIQSAYKNLGFINRTSYGFSDINVYMLLYNSFVRSKLEYASVVWNPGYSTYISDIEDVQRRFLKLVSYRLDGTYPPIGFPHELLLQRFNTSLLSERRTMHLLIYLFKLLHNMYDCSEFLCLIGFQAHPQATRGTRLFYLETPRTNVLKFSPLHQMCSAWNNLQDRVDVFHTNIHSIKQLFHT